MKLIDKDVVIAEITRLKVQYECGWNCAIDKVLEHIDDLEVKEVDLDFEKELYKAFGQVKDFTLCICIAKHFFDLGLKAAQKGE